MCFLCYGKTIVGLDVGVAAAEGNTQSRHCSVYPFIVPINQSLTEPIANSTASKLEFFREAFAYKERRGHPLRTYAIGPRSFVFTLLPLALRKTCIGYHSLPIHKFVDVMLTSLLKVLKNPLKNAFVLVCICEVFCVHPDRM